MEVIAKDFEPLIQLVREYHYKRLSIPTIQRGKVWTTDHLKSLLESILLGFPIGSIFIWDEITPAGDYSFDDEAVPESFILDGQQRITALHSLIYKDYQDTPKIKLDYLYYEHIENEIRLIKKSKNLSDAPNLIKISQLTDDKGNFYSEDYWKDYFRASESRSIRNITNFITKIQTAAVPKIIVKTEKNSRNDYKSVANLFVTINRTSKLLTNNEIVMAKLVSHMREINKEISKIFRYLKTQTNGFYPKTLTTAEEESTKQWILGLLSVFCSDGQAYHTSRNAVLLDEPYLDKLSTSFSYTREAIKLSIEALRAANIYKSHVLPHSSFIVVLSYLLYKFRSEKRTETEIKALNRFIYVGILSQVFLKKKVEIGTRIVARSRSIKEATELILNEHIFNNNSSVDVYLPLNGKLFINQRYNSRVGRDIMAITKALQPFTDWATGAILSHEATSTTNRIEDHHIFPKKVLREQNVTEPEFVDALGNMAAVSGLTNNSVINDKQPSIYLPTIPIQCLEQQKIPTDSTLWLVDNYLEFLQARGETWADYLNEALNIPTHKIIPQKSEG